MFRALVIIALGVALTGTGDRDLVSASEVPAARARLLGHPRSRFPLGVYASPQSEPPLAGALRDAVAQWNQVFAATFGIAAFAWQGQESDAAVIIRFGPAAPSPHQPMGETDVEGDALGVIRLPVRITLAPPVARGQTTATQVLVQVATHELGHALGLPHANDPASIMCCDPGGVNFDDPAVRATYLRARRQPDARTVIPQLVDHYRRVWPE